MSSPAPLTLDDVIDPQAQVAWDLFDELLDCLEKAILLGDSDLAQQIWIPLQAVNSDMLAYYNNVLTGMRGGNAAGT